MADSRKPFDRSIIVDDPEDDSRNKSDDRKAVYYWFNKLGFKSKQMGKILFVSKPEKSDG